MFSLLRKSRSFQIGRNPSISKTNAFRPTTTRATSQQQESSEKKSHRVQWKTSDGTLVFDAFDGETLRTAALRRGMVSPHNGRARLINCRGLGTCGTCAVEIQNMEAVDPRQRNSVERARLAFPPHGGEDQSLNLRLACQVQIRGDIVVTKRTGFWGQKNELAKASPSETYFGNLEFVLDRKSPPDDRSSIRRKD